MKHYKDWHIRTKIFIQFLIIALSSAVSIGIVAFYISSKAIEQGARKQAQETVQQLALNLDYQLKNVESIVETISYNNEIQAILRNDTGNMSRATRQLIESVMLINFSPIQLRDIEIYGNKDSLINVPLGHTLRSPEEINHYKARANIADGKAIWVNEVEANGCMQLLKQIYDLKSMRPLGTIRVGLRTGYLMRFLEDIDFAAEGYLIVMDSDGELIARTGPELYELDSIRRSTQDGFWKTDFAGEPCLTIYESLSNTEIEIYGVIPLRHLYHNVTQLRNGIILIGMFILLIALLLASQMSRLVVKPIKSMIEPMQAASQGDFSFTLSVNSQDEIGQLREGYNAMTSQIKSLIVDVYQAQLLQKESEFRALQAQINPHFLYNTLDTINWMAKMNHMEEISHMVMSISNLMRISINNQRCIIPVSEELQYVKDYLHIQRVRYQERLEAMIDVDEQLYGLKIPKLLLQPLVENAVIHGIEKKRAGGFVKLTGYQEGKLLIFKVEDNGLGIDRDKLDTLLVAQKEEKKGRTGLGLITVHQRIQFLFGAEYGLTIWSEPGIGTSVAIRLPIECCGNWLEEKLKSQEEKAE